MNNGKYETESYRKGQAQKNDRLFGSIELHRKKCVRCGEDFDWSGRKKTKAFDRALFCSRSCSNNRADWWKENAIRYRTIAFHHYKKECALCLFDKVVDIHHIDENRENNEPKNLVPLCPNHHKMVHLKKYKQEIQQAIGLFMETFWGRGVNGNMPALHAGVESSILSVST